MNIGSLFGLEIAARRWQLVLDAYSVNPSKPNYEAAGLFNPLGRGSDGAVAELRTFVAKKARGEAEVEKQRTKVRELRGGARASPQQK